MVGKDIWNTHITDEVCASIIMKNSYKSLRKEQTDWKLGEVFEMWERAQEGLLTAGNVLYLDLDGIYRMSTS